MTWLRRVLKRLVCWNHEFQPNPDLTWDAPYWWKFKKVVKMPNPMDRYVFMKPVNQCIKCGKVKHP